MGRTRILGDCFLVCIMWGLEYVLLVGQLADKVLAEESKSLIALAMASVALGSCLLNSCMVLLGVQNPSELSMSRTTLMTLMQQLIHYRALSCASVTCAYAVPMLLPRALPSRRSPCADRVRLATSPVTTCQAIYAQRAPKQMVLVRDPLEI